MKHFEFEYGQGTLGADLPDTTDVFIPGETVADPPFIPEDKLEAAYKESLAHPIGMKLSSLYRTESKAESSRPVTESFRSVIFSRSFTAPALRRRTFCSLFPTACIREANRRTRSRSSDRSCIINSGTAARSSAMIRKTGNTWWIWGLRSAATRCT